MHFNFYRNFYLATLILAASSSFTGCSWVRDTPKKAEPYSAKGLDLKCIKALPAQLQLLFEGRYTASVEDQQQVAAIWTCLDDSLRAFSTYTRGKNSKYYTAKELQLFANRFLGDEKPITNAFINAIFKLKRDVLGGNDTQLTHGEILSLQGKLMAFGKYIQPLSPYLSTLLKPDGKPEPIRNEASRRLNVFVMNMAELLGDSQNPINWSVLTSFIEELEKYTRKNDPTTLTLVREQIQIYQYFKLLLVGGDEFAIERSKWRPIFQSISNFYNALYMATNTTEIFEQLSLDIQSSETEQRKAVEKITGLLKKLKQDPALFSKKSIVTLADRWAKALLLNTVVFPRTQGSIALKTFLDSKVLRKLAGSTLDEAIKLKDHPRDPVLVRSFTEHLAALIEQSATADAKATGKMTTLSLSTLREYAIQLKPLYEDANQLEIINSGIDVFKHLTNILIGLDSDSVSSKDFSELISKIGYYWYEFSRGDDLADGLDHVSKALQNNTFSTAKLDVLVKAINNFFPKGKKVEDYGFNLSQIGLLKALLVGGNSSTVERNEYADAAKMASALLRTLEPKLKKIPKDFKYGINSPTIELAEAALQAFVENRRGEIAVEDLHHFLFEYLKKNYNIKEATLSNAIIGIVFRVFNEDKGEKPTDLQGTVHTSGLRNLLHTITEIKKSILDLERNYAGLDPAKTPIERAVLLKKLSHPATRDLVSRIQPVLHGSTGMPYFDNRKGRLTTFYFDDLIYKTLVYHLLQWALPPYMLSEDNSDLIRLDYYDAADLLRDINDIVYELNLTFSKNPPEMTARKRMQTINLFTGVGNGDDYIDIYETTEFLTTTSGGKTLLEVVRQELVRNCYPNVNIEDYAMIRNFSYECINLHFFSIPFFKKIYGPVTPQLSLHYENLSFEERNQFRLSTLTAAKSTWQDELSMDLADLEVLVSIPYYTENIFIRLDNNFDGVLKFSEAMAGFPIFCSEIKKAGGPRVKGSCVPGEWPGQVEAIYGYLLINGVPPRGIKPGDGIVRKIREAINFLRWVRYWNWLDKDPEVRDIEPPFLYRKDLLNIISNLSTSIAPASSLHEEISVDPWTLKLPDDAPPELR